MKKTSLSVIFMTVFIDLMGFGILIPILPTFASKDLGISDFGIGILFSSFSFVQFIFNPILGRVSDKYGRRPVILLSLMSTASSYIIFSFSHSFLLLLLSRILGGLGGSNIAVAQAYIADITAKEERSKGMGMIGMAFGLGFVFGPMIGGILSRYGYAFTGFASASFSAMALLFAFLFLKETVDVENTRRLKIANTKILDVKGLYQTLKHPDVGILIFLFFILTFSGATIYGTFALLGYKVYQLSNQQIGYLFGIMGVVGAIIQGGFIKMLTEKFTEKTLILIGTFLMIFGLGLLPYGENFLGVAVVISVLSIGTGIIQPVVLSMISKYSSEHEQGAILGINQSLSALGRVLGPLWGGFAFEFLGYPFPFLTGAAFMVLTFFFSLKFISAEKYARMAKEKVIYNNIESGM
ncbi:MAG: MFS transporter [Ignavibacteria bacterium]|jgi:MFS family permease|nr:MFS transporter [Ignavibacteria bacterium]MCU7501501.1 MFS transporter [Ignavibacteria bacterium]MCU7515983.1 MFS transporter [Ignavibacteria bacterium]